VVRIEVEQVLVARGRGDAEDVVELLAVLECHGRDLLRLALS
jgi:hypothetical protein